MYKCCSLEYGERVLKEYGTVVGRTGPTKAYYVNLADASPDMRTRWLSDEVFERVAQYATCTNMDARTVRRRSTPAHQWLESFVGVLW